MTYLLETRFAPLAQIAIPLLLIAWLAFAPARARLGVLLQIFGTAAFIGALAVTAIWLLPPWWTPYVLGALLTISAVRALLRWRTLPFRQTSISALITSSVFLALGVYSSQQAVRSCHGHFAPPGRSVDLEFPFSEGEFQIAQGGSEPAINGHLRTRDIDLPAVQQWRGVGYALDIVSVDAWGLRATGYRPSDLRAYRIFGARVSAPCSGTIFSAVDGLPDLPPQHPDFLHVAGNHVVLACADFHVVLAHLRSGSVRPKVGDTVHSGDYIGEVGNSGATYEPHLHIHAQEPGSAAAPMSGNPIPMTFGGRFLARNDRVAADSMAKK